MSCVCMLQDMLHFKCVDILRKWDNLIFNERYETWIYSTAYPVYTNCLNYKYCERVMAPQSISQITSIQVGKGPYNSEGFTLQRATVHVLAVYIIVFLQKNYNPDFWLYISCNLYIDELQ